MKWIVFHGCYTSNVDNQGRVLPWQYKLETFFFGCCNVDVVIMSIVSHVGDL